MLKIVVVALKRGIVEYYMHPILQGLPNLCLARTCV